MSTDTFDGLLAQIWQDEVVEITRRLVQIESVNPPGNERAVAEYAAGLLAEAGLGVELIEHAPARASVLARLKGSGETPNLLYSAHLDTVPPGEQPWRYDPLSATVAEGKIWGRGASDMKGGMATAIVAARTVARGGLALKGDLILGLTAGEEIDSLGAVAVADRADIAPLQAIVVSEPSSNGVFVAEKGALWIELATHGKTAHGSMPDLGRNAVMMMVELLNEVKNLQVPYAEHPLLGHFSKSVNTIAGGLKTNVVPDLCRVTIDQRTVPGQDHKQIMRQYEELCARLAERDPEFRATVRVVNDRAPVTTSPDDPIVQRFLQVVAEVTDTAPVPSGVRYYTDAAVYEPCWHAPMIICGPGQAGLAHQPDEFVEIDKLVESAKILTLAAARLLT